MLEYHAFYFEASKQKVKYREFSNINNDSSLTFITVRAEFFSTIRSNCFLK